ncbi:hypothetical protein GCM10022384_52220 [Streptomyces marokkonensis]|uniref:Uncharacterized protein n=1 Tax=Streptomyces marokkonensis TaxID=324855 RepID=A0ABP7RKC3_9ACTN
MAGVHPRHLVRALPERAGQGEDGTAVELGAAGHLGRHLAARRLVVQRPLGGEHQVGAGQAGVQVEVVEQHLETGQQPGPDGGQSRAQPAGGAGAGAVAQVGADDTEVAGEDARPVLQAGRQLLDLCGRRPLLRAEHPGHAPFAAQHVERVAGDEQFGVLQPGVEPRRVDAGEADQLPSAGREFEAVRVQQPGPERLERARAPVRRTRVAAADQDPPDPGVERGADQLADAVRRRGARVAQGAGDQGQSRDGRHLHHRRVPRAEQREVGADGFTDRPGGGQCDQPPAGRGGQRDGRALAAVDERDQIDIGVRQDPADARRDGVGGGLCGQGLLEAAGGHDDTVQQGGHGGHGRHGGYDGHGGHGGHSEYGGHGGLLQRVTGTPSSGQTAAAKNSTSAAVSGARTADSRSRSRGV